MGAAAVKSSYLPPTVRIYSALPTPTLFLTTHSYTPVSFMRRARPKESFPPTTDVSLGRAPPLLWKVRRECQHSEFRVKHCRNLWLTVWNNGCDWEVLADWQMFEKKHKCVLVRAFIATTLSREQTNKHNATTTTGLHDGSVFAA